MAKFSINKKRCLNHYKNSHCDLCSAACPQQAAEPERGCISEERCNACGICYAVCPNYAIEHSVDLPAALAAMENYQEIHLQCSRQNCHSKLPCLGILSAKILCILADAHQVTADLSSCAVCSRRTADYLQSLFVKINGTLPEKTRIDLQMEAVEKPSPAIDRRNFLKQLVGAGVQFMDEVQQAGQEETCRVCNLDIYLKEKADGAAPGAFSPSCIITDSCSGCGLCAKLCPHGAIRLQRKDNLLTFHFSALLCSGCKICEQNCPREALRIGQGNRAQAVFEISLPRCALCGQVFQPIADAVICPDCNSKQKILK